MAQAFYFLGITTRLAAPSFAHSAKGGYHERLGKGLVVRQRAAAC